MKYRELPGLDKKASVISLGTAWFGTAIAEDLAFRLMDAYAAAGGSFLDTAHMYASWVPDGAGMSETTVGKWLRRAGRDRMVVATKGADKAMTREGIRGQLDESLARLGLPAIDLYWLHRDDPSVPAGEILEWLNELVREGRFQAFGCSNWGTARIAEAESYARAKGLRGLCASQIGWSLAGVNPEVKLGGGQVYMDDAILAWHRKTALPVVAYSAQGGGFFAGAYDPEGPAPGLKPNPNIVRFHGTPFNYARLALVKRMAARKGCSPNQLALAYVLNHTFPTFAIAGANTPERMADTCGAADLELGPREVAALERGAE